MLIATHPSSWSCGWHRGSSGSTCAVMAPAAETNLLPRDGRLVLHDQALPRAEADRLLACLLAETPFEQPQVRIMGRLLPVPRLVAWYGSHAYAYSGLVHPPRG